MVACDRRSCREGSALRPANACCASRQENLSPAQVRAVVPLLPNAGRWSTLRRGLLSCNAPSQFSAYRFRGLILSFHWLPRKIPKVGQVKLTESSVVDSGHNTFSSKAVTPRLNPQWMSAGERSVQKADRSSMQSSL